MKILAPGVYSFVSKSSFIRRYPISLYAVKSYLIPLIKEHDKKEFIEFVNSTYPELDVNSVKKFAHLVFSGKKFYLSGDDFGHSCIFIQTDSLKKISNSTKSFSARYSPFPMTYVIQD